MAAIRPLLFVANSAWNLRNFRGSLIRDFVDRGWPVAAAVPAGDEPLGLPCPTYPFPLQADGTRPVAELRSLLALVRLCLELRPGVLFSFTPKANIYAGLAARVTGTPFVPNISGLGRGVVAGGTVRRVQMALYRPALAHAARVFFQNSDDRRRLTEAGMVREERAAMLPGSGVDLQRFRALALPKRDPGEAHLLFVGRLLGDKGLRILAEAMRRVQASRQGVQLTLVGFLGAANPSAITPDELRGWEEEGLLRWAGESDNVQPFHADADALVLPTLGGEGVPRSLLEGAASGRPLITTDVPGCRELVREGDNGFLVSPGDPEALARAILRFADLPLAERKRMGASARRTVEAGYDEQRVIAAYAEAVMTLTAWAS